jgi:hypothetical protein
MYMRDMGAVPLLDREGEVAIAKRIEQGEQEVFDLVFSSPFGRQHVRAIRELLEQGEITSVRGESTARHRRGRRTSSSRPTSKVEGAADRRGRDGQARDSAARWPRPSEGRNAEASCAPTSPPRGGAGGRLRQPNAHFRVADPLIQSGASPSTRRRLSALEREAMLARASGAPAATAIRSSSSRRGSTSHQRSTHLRTLR